MYETLGDKEIRLFNLHPGQFDDGIRCDLVKTKLSENEDERTRYDTISHEYGDPSDTAHISCSSNQLEIPRNLYATLKHLRSPTDVKTFWAAAICINQDSNEEKTTQVRHLHHIYKQAKLNFAWVGENSDDVKDAVADLPAWLTPPSMPARLRPPQCGINVQLPQDCSEFTEPGTTHASQETQRWLDDHKDNLSRMVKFMSRTWLTRLWMLQEINSSNATILVCGGTQVPLVFLVMGFGLIPNPHECMPVTMLFLKALELSGDKEALTTLKTGLQRLADLVKLSIQYSKNRGTLQKLLHDTREYECSDPRDHLFSLSSHAEELIAPTGPRLEIDYSASLETVSKNLSLWFVQHSKHPLWHFGRISRLRNYANSTSANNLPSWVYKLVQHSEEEEPDLAYPLSDYEYNAGLVSEHPSPTWNLSPDGNILSLKGRFIDVLELPDPNPIVSSWRLKRTPAYYQTLIEKLAFYLMLFEPSAGRGEYRKHRCFELITLSRADVTLAAFQEYLAQINAVASGRRTDFPAEGSALVFTDPVQERVEMAVDQAMDRKFGITQGMIGWFPRAAEKGDKVCVFYGGRVPYVVRPKGESFQLIGECWIMDKMDGQGLRGESNEDVYIPLC